MKKNERRSGILLPISALPSPYGIGTLGKEAYDFVDFLKKSGSTIWQILPLGVTSYGDSPYQSFSAKGLNYYFIDLDTLIKKGLLTREEVESADMGSNPCKIDYGKLFDNRIPLLKKAFSRFDCDTPSFVDFLRKGEYRDFAFYMTLKTLHNFRPYYEWEGPERNYSPELEERILREERELYLFFVWTQYEFLDEYLRLKAYCNLNGIEIMGDIPLYLSRDSIECYKNPELFLFDQKGEPTYVAGCPPDYFSPKGQLWGNPIFDWESMKKDGFSFFHGRLDYSLRLYDILRIDHFRGLAAYYRIPYGREDAVVGEWVDGPGMALFAGREDYPIVAEDLGFMDDKVRTLLRETGFPGMKVLEFGFDGTEDNEHLPSNCTENYFSYTGTHDNMPIYGFLTTLDEKGVETYAKTLKEECAKFAVPFQGDDLKALATTTVSISYALKTMANIVPIQDLLLLDNGSRMNTPSLLSDANWSYRTRKEDFTPDLVERIRQDRLRGKRDVH